MSRKQFFLFALFYVYSWLVGQTAIDNFIKEKSDKIRKKTKEKTTDIWEKKQQEYDASNFNYAISFLDNSGLFEADEKGGLFAGSLLGASRFAQNVEMSKEDRAYNNLKNGEILMASNRSNLAEKSFKLAKKLYEEDGKDSTENYAQTISNLGLLYQSRGRYTEAKQFNEDAIKLRQGKKSVGKYIVSLNNNAVLKKETGFYTEAEADLKKTFDLATESNDQLAKALVCNNLAMTYLDMNKLKDAEGQMNKSLTEALVVLKPNSTNYIKLQINLANIYRFEKKYEESEKLYLKAIAEKERLLGAHPDLAHVKMGLAQLYMEMGKNDYVEPLLKSALDINKRKLGENNPATVSTQQELANFYRFNNNPVKALKLMEEVAKKKKEIFGEGHPNYIQALEDLALTQWQNNMLGETKANYKIVIDNTLSYINNFFTSLNDNEKNLYWEKTNTRLQRFYSFAYALGDTSAELRAQLYNTAINTKGFLLSNSSKIRNIISESNDVALKNTYRKWLSTKENLNRAYQLSKEELTTEQVNMDSLKTRADELERELSQKSALFNESKNEQTATLETIQKQLKSGEAAIEIIELNEYKNGFTGRGNYIALLVTYTELKLITLGDVKAIQAAISDFRTKTIEQKPENEAYGIAWKVLDEQLKGITKLYLSLDGAYHQLSINALKDTTSKYLVDKYAIQFIGNTKDIISVKKTESASVKPTSAFLIGNPLYGKKGVVAQLPGTETEVKNITKLLTTYKVKATPLFGANATEAKVKSISSPSILHIATHGYFLADLSQMETTKVLGVDISAAKENPLLRSGVLLANCENVFDENFRPIGNKENGILTAYEAMSLNLDKTDLVVLSACETGLGSVKQGEGVYGLQRAFLIAGAKSIIMSLWSVSDAATMELMTLFYTNFAKSGNKQLAFSNAIKQLKLKYKEPFYWSAFVMLSK
jgi:CHAT domain-containing protein